LVGFRTEKKNLVERRRIGFRKNSDTIKKDERNMNIELNKTVGRYKLMWQNTSSLIITVTDMTKNYFN
jgi:hypothetical protein